MTVFSKLTVRPWASGAPVVEDLEQYVEDVGVGLLDLVEEDHAVWPASHGLGELARLLVADVAWRGADQARDCVLLLVLGHVDPDQGVLLAEEVLGESPGELCLAYAGRAEEQLPTGRFGSFIPALARLIASATAVTAGS